MKNSRIVLKNHIDKNDYDMLKKLEEICIESDNISFKLELDYRLKNAIQSATKEAEINEFMYYVEDELVGYISISNFGGDNLEITGMVHHDYRNRGIFTQLFTLVQDECKRRKSNQILLLCDNKSYNGIKFIQQFSMRHHHSEYDMVLNKKLFVKNENNVLTVCKASDRDALAISNMQYDFFGIDTEEDDTLIIENISNGRIFIAKINDTDIGSVRVEINSGVGGIYGLGVLSEYRGKGYGRELLMWSVEKLIQMGAEKITLQVDTDNDNALNLYKSCGFEENFVMSYYMMRST